MGSFLPSNRPVRIQNWNNNTIGLLWLTSKNILSLKRFPEARKWKIVRLAQTAVASAIQRRLAATSDEQSSAASPCPPSLPECRDCSSEHPNALVRWKQKIVFFSPTHMTIEQASSQQEATYLARDFRGPEFPQQISDHKLFSCGFLFWVGSL